MILSIFEIQLVNAQLNILAPLPKNPCPAVEWYDVYNCSESCGICESCKNHAKRFHVHQCISDKIPLSSEELRLKKAYTEIKNAKIGHSNSTPDTIAGAIAFVKKKYGISDRKFKYGNLPYFHNMKIVWYHFIFSSPEFVSAMTDYIIASWYHVSFKMYEHDAENDEHDAEKDEQRHHELFVKMEYTYKELCALVDQIDDEIKEVIKEISHTHILPIAYRKYKKLLKNYGLVFVCEEDKEEIVAREGKIVVLTATIVEESDKLQTLKVQYDTMEHAYKKLIDACKVDFVSKEDNDEIFAKKEEFFALEGTFLREREKLRNLQKHLDALKKKQRKALENQIQYAESLLAQLEEKL